MQRFHQPFGVTGDQVGNGEEESETQQPTTEEIIKELEATVKRLKVIHEDQQPLDDNTIEVAHFCRGLESIVRHQQKEKISFWGERKDYWHYLTEDVRGMKDLAQLVKSIQNMTELTTSQGRGRAFIRLCLSKQLLADCVQISLNNPKKTKDWFYPGAVLSQPSLSQRLITLLYDIGELTFDLPVTGVDLDETWPSFVQKSFSSTPSSDQKRQQRQIPNLLRALSATKEAKRLSQAVNYQSTLEQALEEEASELLVKQSVPFDLPLAGSLLNELRSLLMEQLEDYTQPVEVPDISVAELDDITSGLTLLRDYVTSKSYGVIKIGGVGKAEADAELKQCKERVSELEHQVKEGVDGNMSLQQQLEDVRSSWRSCREELQTVKTTLREQEEEVDGPVGQLTMTEIKENLATLQQNVEEKEKDLLQQQAQHSELQDELTSLTDKLSESNIRLREAESTKQNLLGRLQKLQTMKEEADSNITLLKENYAQLETTHNTQVTELEQAIAKCTKERDNLKEEVAELTATLNQTRFAHQQEMTRLQENLVEEKERVGKVEEERKQAKEELTSMHGMVAEETESLRFQLSTANMQLQKTTKGYGEKEAALSMLEERLAQLTEEVGQKGTELRGRESRCAELLQQLTIMETKGHNLQDEVTALNDQLAEKTFNRDQVREESLRLRREWDDLRERLQAENQRLVHQSKKTSDENEHLRKAIQKLLQQKVSLWQHADELEQEQVAKGVWLNSNEVITCMGCNGPFTMFNRKHHCRSCGKVFCTQCCKNRTRLPSRKDPERVCDPCFHKIQVLRTPQASSMVNTLAEESVAITPDKSNTQRGSVTDQTSINNFPGGVSLSDSSMLHLDSSDEPVLQSVRDNVHHDAAAADLQSSYTIQPLNSPTIISAPASSSTGGHTPNDEVLFTLTSAKGRTADPDDDFCLIEAQPRSEAFPLGLDSPGDPHLDLRALQKRLARLEDDGSPSVDRRAGTPRERAGSVVKDIQEVSEMLIEGGGMHRVTVAVDTPRTVVTWQFSSQPGGVGFGLMFKVVSSDSEIEVLPVKRVNSHKTVLTGEYVAQKAGIYLLAFHNSNKYSERQLSYKVWKRTPL